ncbi:MAG TPA: hypothetical protein EYP30_00415 [Archaeoglobaceae archaeon]|nr:hypothetical protein [Archaeoglobaceae archaeon]
MRINKPGKPDYVRGKTKGEVKDWSRPVDCGTLKKLNKKGIREITNKSGFTKPAIEYAKKRGIKLFHRKKRVAYTNALDNTEGFI